MPTKTPPLTDLHAIVPPAVRLPADPVCESEQDVHLALQELAWLRARAAAIKAEAKAAANQIATEALGKMRTDVDGTAISFADREAVLDGVIREYATAHREELLPAGRKTRVFTFGEISWRDKPAALEYLEGCSSETALKTLGNRVSKSSGLLGAVLKLLRACAFVGRITCADLIKPSFSFDFAHATKLWGKGDLSPADLKRLGLVVREKSETLNVDVGKYLLRQEQSA